MSRTLLIDGDMVAWRILCVCEEEVQWEPDVWGMWTDLAKAKRLFDDWMTNIEEELEADKSIVALSCSSKKGFRRKLNPTYKANRDGKRKPTGFVPFIEWITEKYEAVAWGALEADDILSILATEEHEGDRLLVSVDKDFALIPHTQRYDPVKKTFATTPTKKHSLYLHALQTLTGDSTDGYSGCPSVGPKKAEKILEGVEPKDYWVTIVEAYKSQGKTEKDALLNARMAYLLQASDYNKEKRRIKLWKPQKFTQK